MLLESMKFVGLFRFQDFAYWTCIVCQVFAHLGFQFLSNTINSVIGRHRPVGIARDVDDATWRFILLLGTRKPEDHKRDHMATKAYIAQGSTRLLRCCGVMTRMAQSLMYWILVISSVALKLPNENNNVGGDDEISMSDRAPLFEVDAGTEHNLQQDTTCDIGNNMICQCILMLAGRKLETYKQHHSDCLKIKIALNMPRQTVRSNINKLQDRQIHSTLVQLLNCLIMCIVHIGDCIGERLPTDFIMVIQGPEAETQHVAGLDSGSAENLISRKTALDSGLVITGYKGPSLVGVGGNPINPKGRVTFRWCVSNFDNWYTTTFAVLENDDCEEFNILLSKGEIAKRRFYIRNRGVLFCSKGNA
ncbi:MAG: hypothetical protein Q9169_006480 [Polycauliona sp. 2 TL-2023]